jgi:hypothetical protein
MGKVRSVHVKLIWRKAWSSSTVRVKNWRMDNPILIKCNTGKLYEKLPNHLNFNLDGSILTTTLYKGINTFFSLPQILLKRAT